MPYPVASARGRTLVFAVAPPAGDVPVNTVAPAITGTSPLACSTGTWTESPTGYAYQWQRGGVDISGATASTYTPTYDDLGATFTCVVTASNGAGAGTPATSAGVVWLEDLTASLVELWKLDEASGDRAGSINGKTLTNGGGVGNLQGLVYPLAAFFNQASNSYLIRASEAALQTGDVDWWLEAYVRMGNLNTQAFVSKAWLSGGGDDDYALYYSSAAGRFRVLIEASSTENFATDASFTPQIGLWYRLFAWHDSTANTLNLQVNDGAVASVSTTITPVTSINSFQIGRSATSLYALARIGPVLFGKGYVPSADERAALLAASRLFLTSLTVSTSWAAGSSNDIQGIASDGTSIFVSNSTALRRYNKTGTLQDTRADTSGDGPGTHTQINGLFVKNGVLYASANNYVGGMTGTRHGWVIEYDPATLDPTGNYHTLGNHLAEGVCYAHGSWWVCYHDYMYVSRYDDSWNHVADYALGFTITGANSVSAGGYDGIAWDGDHLFLNMHGIYTAPEAAIDTYYWTGSEFVPIQRTTRPSNELAQGIAIDPTESGVMWFARRRTSGGDQVSKATYTTT